MVVFGQEIELIECKTVYEIDMKSAKVRAGDDGYENSIEVIYNVKKNMKEQDI